MKPIHILSLLVVLVVFVAFVIYQDGQQPMLDMREARITDYADEQITTLSVRVSDMLFVDNHLYIGSSLDDEFFAIDVDTQEELFSLDYAVSHLAIDEAENLIYATRNERNVNSVLALEMQNNILWENNSLSNTRIPINLYVNPNGNDYAGLPTNEIVYIDPEIGAFVPIVNQPTFDIDLYYAEAGYFWRVFDGHLEARSVENPNEIVWTSVYNSLTAGDMYQVLLGDNYVLINHRHMLSMFNYPTGDLLWQYDTTSIASNFVVEDDEVIYVLDINASLLSLNLRTGEILQSRDFTLTTENANSPIQSDETIGESRITMSQDYVAIYFSDVNRLA
ncbi:MAG: hypothetical protein AAFQ07_01515, partial [Chloroflexota bacterium]